MRLRLRGFGSKMNAAPEETFSRYTASWYLVFQLWTACLVRIAQATITFGAMIPAGLFIPSLFPGACMGRAWGVLPAPCRPPHARLRE